MNIGALHTKHITKDTLLSHIERIQLKVIVTAVFKQHTVQTLLLRQIY